MIWQNNIIYYLVNCIFLLNYFSFLIFNYKITDAAIIEKLRGYKGETGVPGIKVSELLKQFFFRS